MLEKIFSWSKKKEGEEESGVTVPAIRFGRYSDNNKPVAKVEKWNEAESLFKEKNTKKALPLFLPTCAMKRKTMCGW